MAQRGMHLVVGKQGMFSKVACGNPNAILASDYAGFMADGTHRCAKCAKSRQAAYLARKAAEKTLDAGESSAAWITPDSFPDGENEDSRD